MDKWQCPEIWTVFSGYGQAVPSILQMCNICVFLYYWGFSLPMMTSSFEKSLIFGYSGQDYPGGNTICWFGTSVSLHSDILTLISFGDATHPMPHKHDDLWPWAFKLSPCFISLLTSQQESKRVVHTHTYLRDTWVCTHNSILIFIIPYDAKWRIAVVSTDLCKTSSHGNKHVDCLSWIPITATPKSKQLQHHWEKFIKTSWKQMYKRDCSQRNFP